MAFGHLTEQTEEKNHNHLFLIALAVITAVVQRF